MNYVLCLAESDTAYHIVEYTPKVFFIWEYLRHLTLISGWSITSHHTVRLHSLDEEVQHRQTQLETGMGTLATFINRRSNC